MSVRDYLPFATKFLKDTGLYPSSSKYKKCICLFIFLPIALILNLLIIYKFAQANGDILQLAETFESFSCYIQLIIRIFIFVKHGQLIEEIIDSCINQWNYNLFGEELETKFKAKMAFCLKLSKFLGLCALGTIFLMCVNAIIDEHKHVPLLIWIPNFKWSTQVIFVTELIMLLVATHSVVATDSFYILIGMDLQIQYQLIGELMKSINFDSDNDEECLRKITKCIQHHRWLMKLHKKLNTVFSEYFIVQYTVTTAAVAIQAYIVMYTSPSFETALKSDIYFLTIMFQVALYFIPASNIEISAERFALEVYMINWQNSKNLQVYKHLMFMIMRSQKPLNMLGAKMMHIDRPQYLSIIRFGFTIATLLGGLNK